MVTISSLLSVNQPSGFWISIIKAFEGVTNNYVLAIIFLTVVIRLIWGIVDTVQKYNSQQMSAVQAKMAPELEKIKKKYANQPDVLQQKQNELNKKYMGKSYFGGCFTMFVVMGLNLLIFFTLFSGLNTMSAFKIAQNYDNIKFNYVNALNVTDKYFSEGQGSIEEKAEIFKDYKNISFVIKENDNGKTVNLVHSSYSGEKWLYDTILATTDYSEDFSATREDVNEAGEPITVKVTTNENIIKLIQKYFPVYEEGEEAGSKEIIVGYEQVEEGEDKPIYLSTLINNVIMQKVVEVYDVNQESFLWIKNIWIADSPLNKSIVSFSTLKSQVGKNTFEANEETIYNAFMPQLKEKRSVVNGYFILSILCVAVSILTMQITKIYNNRKNKRQGLPVAAKQGSKWAQLIAPLIMGIFALFYNSVFAIYMLVGQIVSCILLVPQLMFVDWVIDKKKNKNNDTSVIDYSRKF